MLRKSLLSLFALSCVLNSMLHAQGGGCGPLLRVAPSIVDLALARRTVPAFFQRQYSLLPRYEPLAITPPANQYHHEMVPVQRNENPAPIGGLMHFLFGQNQLGQRQPITYNPHPITYPTPILRSDDGIFRSPGSPFPPIGNGNGFFLFHPGSEEDDEDGMVITFFPEPPLIYRAEAPNHEEEENLLIDEGTTPLADGLEQLLRAIHFALGHYRADNLAAPTILAAIDDLPPEAMPLTVEPTLRDLIDEILELWEDVANETRGYFPMEALSRDLFYHLLFAFHSPAVPLEGASIERAQIFINMLTEGAQVNRHRLPDPVILAHLIYEIEGLLNQDEITITFNQLLDLLDPLFNREEAAFLARENHGIAPNPAHDPELFETVIYAFLEARASLLLFHLVDPRILQVSMFNLHHNIQTFGPQIVEGTLHPKSHSGIALARAFRALLKAQYRFQTACTLLWDTELAAESVIWTQWQQFPYSQQQFQRTMEHINRYRIQKKLQPTATSTSD